MLAIVGLWLSGADAASLTAGVAFPRLLFERRKNDYSSSSVLTALASDSTTVASSIVGETVSA